MVWPVVVLNPIDSSLTPSLQGPPQLFDEFAFLSHLKTALFRQMTGLTSGGHLVF